MDFRYTQATKRLIVTVPGGRTYEFPDFPSELSAELISHEDPHEFFRSQIMDEGFEHHTNWPDLATLLEEIREVLLIDEQDEITVHSRGTCNDTPLHVACVWGDITAVELLIAAGARVDAPGDLQTTPLFQAVNSGCWRCARLLIAQGASWDAPNTLKVTARQRALASKEPAILALLTEP